MIFNYLQVLVKAKYFTTYPPFSRVYLPKSTQV